MKKLIGCSLMFVVLFGVIYAVNVVYTSLTTKQETMADFPKVMAAAQTRAEQQAVLEHFEPIFEAERDERKRQAWQAVQQRLKDAANEPKSH